MTFFGMGPNTFTGKSNPTTHAQHKSPLSSVSLRMGRLKMHSSYHDTKVATSTKQATGIHSETLLNSIACPCFMDLIGMVQTDSKSGEHEQRLRVYAHGCTVCTVQELVSYKLIIQPRGRDHSVYNL